MPPAPTPWTVRAAMSMATLTEPPQRALPAMKTRMAARKTRLRPRTPEAWPRSGMTTAEAMA